MRHLWTFLADAFLGPACGWCGERVRAANLDRHWHLDHCGDTPAATPARPQGVTVHHVDGTTTPVELAYRGVDDGLHVWDAVTPVGHGDVVKIDVLPSRTGISFPNRDAR